MAVFLFGCTVFTWGNDCLISAVGSQCHVAFRTGFSCTPASIIAGRWDFQASQIAQHLQHSPEASSSATGAWRLHCCGMGGSKARLLLLRKAGAAVPLVLHKDRTPRCFLWKNAAWTVFLWLDLPDVSLVYASCYAGVFLVVQDDREVYSPLLWCSTNPFLFRDVASCVNTWL